MSRRRRYDIAFYSPFAGPIVARQARPSGGAEMQILHLARGLAARGVRVAVVTFATPGLPEEVDGIHLIAHPRPALRSVALRRGVVLAAMLTTLVRLDARVLVQRAAGSTTGFVALAARVRRRRFAYSSASTIDFAFEELEQSRVTQAIYALGVRLADPIVVQTDEQARLCRARFGREPQVIRSIAERAPARTATPDEFLWIGRIAGYKNPLAYAELARAVPEARFAMVCVRGDGDPPELSARLEQAAAELPNLELVAQLDRPALLARVERAAAIVSTSDYEGMPNTLLEGWSRGVPALTLAHDPDGTIAREELGACANGDPERLASLARELWEDRAPGGPLAERCRAYVAREHDPDVVVDRWLAALGVAAPQRPASVR